MYEVWVVGRMWGSRGGGISGVGVGVGVGVVGWGGVRGGAALMGFCVGGEGEGHV